MAAILVILPIDNSSELCVENMCTKCHLNHSKSSVAVAVTHSEDRLVCSPIQSDFVEITSGPVFCCISSFVAQFNKNLI